MTLSQPHDEMKRDSSTLREKPRYKYERLGINMHPAKMAVAAVIVALLLISITGCTESQNTTQSVSSTPTQGQGQSQGQSTQDMSVTIKPMGTTMQIGSYDTPKAGDVFVQYMATVKDNKVDSLDVSPIYFSLQASNGVIYDIDGATYSSEIHGFESVKLVPGGSQSGILVFQIPQNVKPVAVLYKDFFGAHKITTNL